MELIVTYWEDSLKPGDQLGEEGPFRGQVGEAEGLHHGAHSSGGQRRRWLAGGSKDGKSKQNQMTGRLMIPQGKLGKWGRQASFRTGHIALDVPSIQIPCRFFPSKVYW